MNLLTNKGIILRTGDKDYTNVQEDIVVQAKYSISYKYYHTDETSNNSRVYRGIVPEILVIPNTIDGYKNH